MTNRDKAFGISKAGTEGSARLIKALSAAGAEATRRREWTPEEREQRRKRAIEGVHVASLVPEYTGGPFWTAEELALLGTMSDDEVAAEEVSRLHFDQSSPLTRRYYAGMKVAQVIKEE